MQEQPPRRIVPIDMPWMGQCSDLPPVKVPPGGFDEVLNFFVDRGRMITRPKLEAYITSVADGKSVYIIRSFLDINGNYHTILVTTKTCYALSGAPALTALNPPSGVTDLGSIDRPYGVVGMMRRVYFSNGVKSLIYCDGSADLKIAGDTPGGCRFLAVVGQHLVQAYTFEGGVNYPNRVRWSVVGNPASYEGYTSGFADLPEVPDELTGITSSSRTAFIFRPNGVTLMTATGLGSKPFSFEHLSTEPDGVGCRYPYTLASYGNRFTFFVSDDDVYQMTLPDMIPIGGLSRRAIFKDIALANGPIVGRMIPNYGVAFEHLSYQLTIPKSGTSTTWVFDCTSRLWTKLEATFGALTAQGTVYLT